MAHVRDDHKESCDPTRGIKKGIELAIQFSPFTEVPFIFGAEKFVPWESDPREILCLKSVCQLYSCSGDWVLQKQPSKPRKSHFVSSTDHTQKYMMLPIEVSKFLWCARENGEEWAVRVRYVEGLAIRSGPESCAVIREGFSETLTGVHTGQLLRREKFMVSGADIVTKMESNTAGRANARACTGWDGLIPWNVRTFVTWELEDLGLGRRRTAGPRREGEEP
jgi:hypothetical protein